MAVDYFLKIDGVTGESKDKDHRDEVEIESFSWGALQRGTNAYGTGAGGGKVSMRDFNFLMRINKASPSLFLYCSNGKHISEVTLTGRKAGGTQQTFLVIKFGDVMVSSYQTVNSMGQTVPMDQISMSFTKIEIEYLAQDEKGNTKSAAKKYWDIKANTGQ